MAGNAGIVSAWADQKAIREIMVFLQSHGVGTSRAVRIYRTYGDEAIAKVTENPYRLALDIWGIGFKSADTIAQKLGMPPDSLLRAQAGVRHALQVWSEQGHCAAPRDKLAAMAGELLDIPEAILEPALQAELAAENQVLESTEDAGPLLYLTPMHRAETGCANQVRRLLNGALPWGGIKADQAIPWVKGKTGLSLSESQRAAVATVLASKVAIITGGPGVGKTTLVNSLLRILRAKRVNVLLCAPTGRAAQRMTETTGIEAKTVHRLLEFDPKAFRFKRDGENPLDTDLSEYPVVVIPMALQHYLLLERNLLYTAVTRGKQLVVVIAEPKALRMAVRNRKAARRITRLAARLAARQS